MHSKQIKKIYSDIAKEYDKMAINEGKYVAYKKIGLWTAEELNKKNVKILDLGCGTGLSSLEFFKKGYHVTGVDITESMIKEAKKFHFEKLICQNLEVPLKVQNNSFDAVVLIGVMEFINNPSKLFREINKKLIKDGIFSLTVPKKLPKTSKLEIKSYYKKEIELIFKKTGFKILKRGEFFGYIKHGETVRYNGYVLKKK